MSIIYKVKLCVFLKFRLTVELLHTYTHIDGKGLITGSEDWLLFALRFHVTFLNVHSAWKQCTSYCVCTQNDQLTLKACTLYSEWFVYRRHLVPWTHMCQPSVMLWYLFFLNVVLHVLQTIKSLNTDFFMGCYIQVYITCTWCCSYKFLFTTDFCDAGHHRSPITPHPQCEQSVSYHGVNVYIQIQRHSHDSQLFFV